MKELSFRFISPNIFFLYFILLRSLQLVHAWGCLLSVSCGRQKALRGWRSLFLSSPVCCVWGQNGEWCHALLSLLYRLALGIPKWHQATAASRAANSSQELELDFSFSLLEWLTATYSGLALWLHLDVECGECCIIFLYHKTANP